MDKSKAILSKLPFVCFDIETTGLEPKKHEIVEIAAVKFSIEEGVTDTFSSLIAPENEIPYAMTKIHGITNDMVTNAPSIERVLIDFIAFIDELPLLAHNNRFDAGFVGYQLKNLNLPSPKNLIYDTLTLARKIMPNSKKHNLPTLVKRFKIKVSQAHRALPDAEATMEVFKELMTLWMKDEEKYLADLNSLNQPIQFSKFA